MNGAAVVGVVAAAVGLAVALVVVVVVVARTSRPGPRLTAAEAAAAGWRWQGEGLDVLTRCGVVGVDVTEAGAVLTRDLGGRTVVAARTSGRSWTVRRGSVTMTSRVSGAPYALCSVRLPAALPTIHLLREGAGGGLATAVGVPDVDTESGAFNEGRRVVSDDDRVAHAVLAPHVIAEVSAGPADATLQVVGDRLLSFRPGEPDLAELAARAAWLVRVADAIPGFVYDERRD
ncbi:hypothetical protein KIN34_05440 [Cellulomonas sp. DKR-3]|uniref:Uncharacterized protein n=1 Tax=Cellulomonas fulva TaxID=2835530 RepID=A0ABS5TX94_9CELL|nr:hypothetical protein [Cellulomonas fulva]MBT0993727.1 hypothetical protein [Cellulomonas fulva]